MTALPDLSSHAMASARWRPAEIVFWILAAVCALLFPSRYLIMTDIVRLALFALSLDLILGYAGVVSLGHAAFFGVGAYSAGLLALHGIVTEPVVALVVAGLVATAVGFLTSFLVIRGVDLTRLMVTLGIALLLEALGALFQHHRRHRRAAGHRDATDPRPVRVRHVRQGRLFLFPCGTVPAVSAGAADRALAVRPVAARHPKQSATGGGDRNPRQQAVDRDLYARGILCRDSGRAVHPDHGARLARRVRVRAFRRPDAGAGDRRHGLSLRRGDLRPRVPGGATGVFG